VSLKPPAGQLRVCGLWLLRGSATTDIKDAHIRGRFNLGPLQGPAITEIDSPLRWTAFVFVPEILAGGRGLPILGAKIRTLGSRAGLAAAIGAAGASEQVVLEKRAGSLA
jgi:hypothetical protein